MGAVGGILLEEDIAIVRASLPTSYNARWAFDRVLNELLENRRSARWELGGTRTQLDAAMAVVKAAESLAHYGYTIPEPGASADMIVNGNAVAEIERKLKVFRAVYPKEDA